jgi:serine kinase of HPr protein (carbohydrate metabolism regulator)
MTAPEAVHATCVVVGEAGILIRGPSGAGKSTMARQIVAQAAAAGSFARLVADDRTLVERRGDRVLARPHPAIAGSIEVRGLGVARAPHEPAVRIALVVDLVAAPPRMPEARDESEVIQGVALPRIRVATGDCDRVLIALGLGPVER